LKAVVAEVAKQRDTRRREAPALARAFVLSTVFSLTVESGRSECLGARGVTGEAMPGQDLGSCRPPPQGSLRFERAL